MPAPPNGWTRPPFAAEIFANQVYGRGALDMKGIGITQLAAFVDVARSHRTPEHDIIFLAVADEERGGALGTEWLIAHRPDIFEGVRYALNEGGINEMESEKVTYFGIELGSKFAVPHAKRFSARASRSSRSSRRASRSASFPKCVASFATSRRSASRSARSSPISIARSPMENSGCCRRAIAS